MQTFYYNEIGGDNQKKYERALIEKIEIAEFRKEIRTLYIKNKILMNQLKESKSFKGIIKNILNIILRRE